MNDSEFPIIQLYSPEHWHEPQVIVCNAAGRALLKKLIDGPENSVFAMPDDGEWADVILIETEDTEQYPLPYTDSSIVFDCTDKQWRHYRERVNETVMANERKRRN